MNALDHIYNKQNETTGEFDSLFDGQAQTTDEEFDKEAWAEKKREERAELNFMVDEMTKLTFSDPKELGSYLDMQSRLGKMGVVNTLLVLAQNPEATFVADYDTWADKGRFLSKGEGKNSIKVLHADGEYEREDGTMATGYKVERLYDISQTYGKSISPRSNLSMPIKSKLKALTTDTPVKIQLSDTISKESAAIYSKDDNTIYVAKGLNGEQLFSAISLELARSQNFTENPEVDAFVSECAADIVCRRFGISASYIKILDDVADMEIQEQRGVLSAIHKTATKINERVDLNLNIERHQQKDQPAR